MHVEILWQPWADGPCITSLPKVIWEEGRVAALSNTYTIKSPLVTMARPKSTPSRGPIPKPHYLPHPWTHPTYDAKQHQDPIRHFFTMHWTDRRMDAPTDRSWESLITYSHSLMTKELITSHTYVHETGV